MKKILAIGLLIIITAFASNAQKNYSNQNLEKASQEDLNLYLNKAKKTKTAGIILTIVGSIALAGGSVLLVDSTVDVILDTSSTTEVNTMAYLLIGGAVTTYVGLPLLIVGSSRVNKINRIKYAKFNGVTMEFAPCNFYNYQAQNHQLGLTLRVKF